MCVLLRGIHLFLCLLQNYYALLAPQTQFTKREKVQGLSTLTFKHVGDSVWHVQNERKQKHDYLHHRAVEYGTAGNVADLTRRGFFFFYLLYRSLQSSTLPLHFSSFKNEYTSTHKEGK